MVRPRAEQRGVSFAASIPAQYRRPFLPTPPRLRQALINIAGNGVKFTERGSVRIVATLLPTWCGDQPALQIQVIDTGIGIRNKVLPQLFQPFYQGDPPVSGKYGGSGLGLAIAHHIAHLLGGDVTVSSMWGQGSTFTLTVPTGSLDDVPMLQKPAEAMQDITASPGNRPPKVSRGYAFCWPRTASTIAN